MGSSCLLLTVLKAIAVPLACSCRHLHYLDLFLYHFIHFLSFCTEPKNFPCCMQMQLDKPPWEGGSCKHFIALQEWIGKGTSRLMCCQQKPSDAGDGLVGLGADQGCTLLCCMAAF